MKQLKSLGLLTEVFRLCNIFENLAPAQGRGDNVEVLLSVGGGPATFESRLVDDFSPDESAAEAFPAY